MAKTINLSAPKSIKLSKLGERKIRELVIKEADRALKELPSTVRYNGVNSVMIQSNPTEILGDGVWVQWTRACCDRRRRIEDFTNPTLPELTTGLDVKAAKQDHFDSAYSVRMIPKAHKAGADVKASIGSSKAVKRKK